jgi:hypothetical protein
MSETPEQEHILNRAAVRWHSDDPIVCLQRALVECERLEQLERERAQPSMERVFASLKNLSRIADTLARLAGIPDLESLRAERRIVDVGDGGPVERLICECAEPDPQLVFPDGKPTHCARCSMWLR